MITTLTIIVTKTFLIGWFLLVLVVGFVIGASIMRRFYYERITDEAFEEAKQEYLRFFHERFDPTAESAASAFNRSLERENEDLKNQIKIYKEELAKERKKNESISSS